MKKILILTANPKNSDKLRLDEEVREIQEGLQRSRSRDQFEIISKWAVRPDDLRRALLDLFKNKKIAQGSLLPATAGWNLDILLPQPY